MRGNVENYVNLFKEYKKIKQNGHVIHVLIVDPSEYEASLVSAHNQVFGREKVGDIAKRENADIAINAGFFEIGGNQDGRSTGTSSKQWTSLWTTCNNTWLFCKKWW